MKVTPTDLPEVLIIDPDVYRDQRGYLLETYQLRRYLQLGVHAAFVQDNLSFSEQGVLRGLHYQLGQPQGKLVTVMQGKIFDVAADIRLGSPTFGRWVGIELSSEDHRQIYVPEGFAHGFYVLSETAVVLYKCTDFYAPPEERGLLWNCPALDISWPFPEPLLSPKDAALPALKDVDEADLPRFLPSSGNP
jgi:dTDP-4-dehydrorhamnose 3,5-epimerase